MLALQKTGNPEKIKPPDRIGEKFADDECPSLAEREQSCPPGLGRRHLGITAYVVEFGFRDARVLLWLAINQQPEHEPNETERSNSNECASPAPPRVQPRHHERCEHGAKARAGIKYTGG